MFHVVVRLVGILGFWDLWTRCFPLSLVQPVRYRFSVKVFCCFRNPSAGPFPRDPNVRNATPFHDAPPCAAYLPRTCVPAVRLFLVVMASYVLSQPVLCVARRPEPTDVRSSVSTTASGVRCDQFVCLLTALVSATPNCTIALRVADMICGSPRAPTRTTMKST
eukprot:COSAG01_NODE_4334_length_5127_cov_10.901750_6_plen_164_part_00